jgi:hypothetical protein
MYPGWYKKYAEYGVMQELYTPEWYKKYSPGNISHDGDI